MFQHCYAVWPINNSEDQTYGHGMWKMNVNHLLNEDYKENIKRIIEFNDAKYKNLYDKSLKCEIIKSKKRSFARAKKDNLNIEKTLIEKQELLLKMLNHEQDDKVIKDILQEFNVMKLQLENLINKK